MENILHEFNPVIYPRRVWITYLPGQCEDEFEDVEKFDMESTHACCDFTRQKESREGGVLIRFRSKEDMTTETITHEAIHAANGILDYCGVGVGTANDEALAYLAGWVAKCCEEVKTNANKNEQ